MSSHGQHRRGTPQLLPSKGMLPLLDILFATIGILIVIMVVRSPDNKQTGIAYSVDALLICTDGVHWSFYQKPSLPPISFPGNDMDALFSKLGNYPKLNLLVAFSAKCFRMKDNFTNRFEAARAMSSKSLETTLRLARVVFMPLEDSPQAVQNLINRWSKEDHSGESR